MIDHFTEFIKKHALFNPKDKILLAFSGGIDSMVMVDLFSKSGYKFGLAHCNFSLRGKDSDLDEETAKSVAEIYQVPVFIKRFDTQEFAKSKRISIEMAARELRYIFFEEIMDRELYDYVATAHHQGDVLETMILNLAKGTGISGLRGIMPRRVKVVRPLLFASKSHIIDYAVENKLKWREDKSNDFDIYQRNLIRLQVVPQLLKINPRLFESLEKTTAKLRLTEKIYLRHIKELKDRLLRKNGRNIIISKSQLLQQDEPTVVLAEIIKEFGFNYDQCESIIDAIDHTGALFLSPHFCLNVDRNNIFISPNELDEKSIVVELFNDLVSFEDEGNTYICKIFDDCQTEINHTKETATLDFDKLKFPLIIRNWQLGDKFIPLGMNHKKKLSDFMIDEKIPLNLKRSVKVLISDHEIAWVVGYRINERFKITPETNKIFEITVNKK